MAVTLVATVKSATANAYEDTPAADAYFNIRLNSEAWTSITDVDVKRRALITATMMLDVEQYVGQKTTTAQALKWPRKAKDSEYVKDEDGNTLDPDTIPTIVKTAMYELALELVKTLGSDPLAPDFLLKLESLSLPGGLNLDFRDPGKTADTLPPQVVRLLRTVRKGNTSIKRIVRT